MARLRENEEMRGYLASEHGLTPGQVERVMDMPSGEVARMLHLQRTGRRTVTASLAARDAAEAKRTRRRQR